MARSFAVTAQSAQWTLSGYMLSLGSLFIVAGRIGDIVGRKRAFGTGCLLFTATMIGAALAPSLPVLVLFRVLQGAGAGLMFPVGIALVLPTFVTSWWAYVPVFASCGFGLGLGWTFTNIATQEVVGADRAGEASGVVLTFLVTTGGVGLAGAASIIGGLLRAGHDRASAYNTTLLAFALLALAAAAAVLATRHMLVRRGLISRCRWPPTRPARPPRRPEPAAAHGWVSDIPECALFPACDLGHAQCARAPVAQLDRAAAF